MVRAGRESRQEAGWNEGGYIQKTRQGSHQVDSLFSYSRSRNNIIIEVTIDVDYFLNFKIKKKEKIESSANSSNIQLPTADHVATGMLRRSTGYNDTLTSDS